ncbi:MAG: hypothetical protein K9J27_05630 [Bacteroidales bacterium]|nr:hypothetical protein [Bacteroidales bacterium]MCF8333400.1 hypothetical protein [Bacteroidales bacterium]
MKFDAALLLLFFIPLLSFSQEYIYPGESKTITAETDTLYVISIEQMREAVIAKKKNKTLRELNDTYQEKICTLEAKTAELDSLVAIHEKDAIYYRKQWRAAEEDLSKAAREARRQHRLKIFAGIGGAAAGVIIGLLF